MITELQTLVATSIIYIIILHDPYSTQTLDHRIIQHSHGA